MSLVALFPSILSVPVGLSFSSFYVGETALLCPDPYFFQVSHKNFTQIPSPPSFWPSRHVANKSGSKMIWRTENLLFLAVFFGLVASYHLVPSVNRNAEEGRDFTQGLGGFNPFLNVVRAGTAQCVEKLVFITHLLHRKDVILLLLVESWTVSHAK